MSINPEVIDPMKIEAISAIINPNPSLENKNALSNFGTRFNMATNPNHLDFYNVFAGNQSRQAIARVFGMRVLDIELQYLQNRKLINTEAESFGFVEQFIAGILHKNGSDPPRIALTREILQRLAKKQDQSELLAVYASKCGDFIRAFFDSDMAHGNQNIAVNFIKEAKTLALLRMLIEKGPKILEVCSKGQITVNASKQLGVCEDFTSAGQSESAWSGITLDLLRNNLSLVNAVTAISSVNQPLAERIFGNGGINVDRSFLPALQQFDNKFTRRHEGVFVYGKPSDQDLPVLLRCYQQISQLFN